MEFVTFSKIDVHIKKSHFISKLNVGEGSDFQLQVNIRY